MKLISKREDVTNGVVIKEQRCDADYVGFTSRLSYINVWRNTSNQQSETT